MKRDDAARPPEKAHGSHTLRVHRGVVVGVFGDDVFVELAPRMQGVISRRAFPQPPREGDVHEYTLRGKEESLWALQLAEQRSLASWEEMEPGSIVAARVVRVFQGGLQLKVGALHAFLPRSQTGLKRGHKPDELVGKTLTCEVLEVDPERQRVVVSRKAVLARQKAEARERRLDSLQPGRVVQGRVTRLEAYGAFVAFGRGQEGLVHVSNLSHQRVEHPADVLKVGDALEAKILWVKQGGKRIGLGVKQLAESPWRELERSHYEGEVVEGAVTRLADFGVFVALRRGVEGLLPNAETGRADKRARDLLRVGQRVAVRIVALDVDAERMTLSLLHRDGSPIAPEEAERSLDFAAWQQQGAGDAPAGTNLGALLRRALGRGLEGDAAAAG